MSVKKARLYNSTPFTWSDGTLFNGYLMIVTVFPTLNGDRWTYATLNDSPFRLRVPTVYKFPIREGYLADDCYVWANFTTSNSIAPPQTTYSPIYFDNSDRLIKIENDNWEFGEGDQNIVTGSAFSLPTSGFATGHSQTVPGTVPTVETPTGTIDGSNRTFTLSRVPNSLILFHDGQGPLTTPAQYTLSGATLTMAVGHAPIDATQFKAYIF